MRNSWKGVPSGRCSVICVLHIPFLPPIKENQPENLPHVRFLIKSLFWPYLFSYLQTQRWYFVETLDSVKNLYLLISIVIT